MESNNHDDYLLARWLANELTADELDELRQREDFADLQAIVEGMEGLDMPPFEMEALWEKLKQRMQAVHAVTETDATTGRPISEGEKKEAAPGEWSTSHELLEDATADAMTGRPISEGENKEAAPGEWSASHELLEDATADATTGRPISEGETAVKKNVLPDITGAGAVPPITGNLAGPTGASTNKAAPGRMIPLRWAYSAAAAVVILLGLFFWLRDTDPSQGYETIVETKAGKQLQTKLPDGSTVELNAASTLAFTDLDWSADREAFLRGEAYFRAKKGKTFTVKTEQGSVRVIGTQFNVYARDQVLEVKCTDGTVQVFNPAGSEKALVERGEQISVVGGRMQRRAGIDFTPKWFNGESVFRSAPRSRVFGEMERQYGITIVAEGLEEKPFSGKFLNNDLEKALKMVAVPMGLQYEMRNDTVWFSE